jgi:hypothetical protein
MVYWSTVHKYAHITCLNPGESPAFFARKKRKGRRGRKRFLDTCHILCYLLFVELTLEKCGKCEETNRRLILVRNVV